jgi:hypothetical protein
VVFLYVRRREQIEGNLVLMKQIRASKIAQKYLKNAKKLVDEGNRDLFYEETARSLWAFVANKLNIPPAELTKENIKERLLERVPDNELVDKLIDLINLCEEARYSPQFNNVQLQNVYATSVEVLSKLSEKLL